ncbi:uncharacterized protein AMSG_02301 [Thecamonas trahens ATCC 50062]|uniref:PH domain-containing protein n=1 Tax=Thecamonas trahens ATCC 50062 TaxID=461836 RepID=A0A0L0DW73_THETB|nr:hypothetical protein AMSG_02301 [Thecamonas trahens ATCC 50062]KNC56331.1 hypothetical protein AMSG_02301 [Thecamonas trahens ATCC 50062]|eukprot:XP_013760848.1 hypothetical protein AMSG_02301 [Thecamonas trahens ATCC 50062]
MAIGLTAAGLDDALAYDDASGGFIHLLARSAPAVQWLSLAGNALTQAAPIVSALSSLHTLSLRLNVIDDAGLAALGDVLPSSRIAILSLALNAFTANGLAHFARNALPNCRSLVSLDLSGNVVDAAAASALGSAILSLSSLAALSLAACGLDSLAALHLAAILPAARSLLHLNLASNTLSDEGCQFLATALARPVALTHLDLSYNAVSDSGGHALAAPLASVVSAPALAHLSLRGNGIGFSAALALVRSVASAPLDGVLRTQIDLAGNGFSSANIDSLLLAAGPRREDILLIHDPGTAVPQPGTSLPSGSAYATSGTSGLGPTTAPHRPHPLSLNLATHLATKRRLNLDALLAAPFVPEPPEPTLRKLQLEGSSVEASYPSDALPNVHPWHVGSQVPGFSRMSPFASPIRGPDGTLVPPPQWEPHYVASLHRSARSADRLSLDAHAYALELTPSHSHLTATDAVSATGKDGDESDVVRLGHGPLPRVMELEGQFPLSLLALLDLTSAPRLLATVLEQHRQAKAQLGTVVEYKTVAWPAPERRTSIATPPPLLASLNATKLRLNLSSTDFLNTSVPVKRMAPELRQRRPSGPTTAKLATLAAALKAAQESDSEVSPSTLAEWSVQLDDVVASSAPVISPGSRFLTGEVSPPATPLSTAVAARLAAMSYDLNSSFESMSIELDKSTEALKLDALHSTPPPAVASVGRTPTTRHQRTFAIRSQTRSVTDIHSASSTSSSSESHSQSSDSNTGYVEVVSPFSHSMQQVAVDDRPTPSPQNVTPAPAHGSPEMQMLSPEQACDSPIRSLSLASELSEFEPSASSGSQTSSSRCNVDTPLAFLPTIKLQVASSIGELGASAELAYKDDLAGPIGTYAKVTNRHNKSWCKRWVYLDPSTGTLTLFKKQKHKAHVDRLFLTDNNEWTLIRDRSKMRKRKMTWPTLLLGSPRIGKRYWFKFGSADETEHWAAAITGILNATILASLAADAFLMDSDPSLGSSNNNLDDADDAAADCGDHVSGGTDSEKLSSAMECSHQLIMAHLDRQNNSHDFVDESQESGSDSGPRHVVMASNDLLHHDSAISFGSPPSVHYAPLTPSDVVEHDDATGSADPGSALPRTMSRAETQSMSQSTSFATDRGSGDDPTASSDGEIEPPEHSSMPAPATGSKLEPPSIVARKPHMTLSMLKRPSLTFSSSSRTATPSNLQVTTGPDASVSSRLKSPQVPRLPDLSNLPGDAESDNESNSNSGSAGSRDEHPAAGLPHAGIGIEIDHGDVGSLGSYRRRSSHHSRSQRLNARASPRTPSRNVLMKYSLTPKGGTNSPRDSPRASASDDIQRSMPWLSLVTAADVLALADLQSNRLAEVPVSLVVDNGSTPRSGYLLVLDLHARSVSLVRKRRMRKNTVLASWLLIQTRTLPRTVDNDSFTLEKAAVDAPMSALSPPFASDAGADAYVLAAKDESRVRILALFDAFRRTARGSPECKVLMGKTCRVAYAIQGSELYKHARGALVHVDKIICGGWLRITDSRRDTSYLHAVTLRAIHD